MIWPGAWDGRHFYEMFWASKWTGFHGTITATTHAIVPESVRCHTLKRKT
jgi:hypothetical protein